MRINAAFTRVTELSCADWLHFSQYMSVKEKKFYAHRSICQIEYSKILLKYSNSNTCKSIAYMNYFTRHTNIRGFFPLQDYHKRIAFLHCRYQNKASHYTRAMCTTMENTQKRVSQT